MTRSGHARLAAVYALPDAFVVVANHHTLVAAGADVDARDIEPGVVYERDGLRVTAIRVDHGAIAPAYGYRIDFSGRSVVLSGDTRVSPALMAAAAGTQLVIHEVFQSQYV